MFNAQHCLHSVLPIHRNTKTKNHSGTADITTFYHKSRPTSSKTIFKQMSAFVHLVYILYCLILYLFYSYFNILAFMCICV